VTGGWAAARVILFDDLPRQNAMFADELEEAGVQVVGVASTPDEVHRIVRSVVFDVAILDLLVGREKAMTGLSIGLWLREHRPDLGLVMLTSCESPFPAHRLLDTADRPGVGYLLKNSVQQPGEITAAISLVRSGRDAVVPEIAEQLPWARELAERGGKLTPTQVRTIELVAEGRTTKQISAELNLSPKTVDARLTDIFAILGVGDGDDTLPANQRVRTTILWREGLRDFCKVSDVKPMDWDPTPTSAEPSG
jgi:DNA-binding NarL/FixJ family response regulator